MRTLFKIRLARFVVLVMIFQFGCKDTKKIWDTQILEGKRYKLMLFLCIFDGFGEQAVDGRGLFLKWRMGGEIGEMGNKPVGEGVELGNKLSTS